MAKKMVAKPTNDTAEQAVDKVVAVVDSITDNQAVKHYAAGVITGATMVVAAVKIGADIAD